MSDITLKEIAGRVSSFPQNIRESLISAVENVSADNLPKVLSRHESDPNNFDALIEAELRNLLPNIRIESNVLVAGGMKFNMDLLISSNDNRIIVEIEKGCLARFEFDVLKMMACSSEIQRLARCDLKCFGAFIIPEDNLVARHIAGNSRESSYQYLNRIFRLINHIEFSFIEDILLIGYNHCDDSIVTRRKKTIVHPRGSDIIRSDSGLLPKKYWGPFLSAYPADLIVWLRKELFKRIPSIKEKFNPGSRYFGYSLGRGYNRLYIYVQKSKLVVDIRIDPGRAEELRGFGFKVSLRDNFQRKNGWLTGWEIPYGRGMQHREMVLQTILETFINGQRESE